MKIKKGDIVKIISGKDRNKSGKVMAVDYAKASVLLENLNVFKKHQRPKKQGEKGEVVNVVRPLGVAKVALLCPNCKKGTRIGIRLEGGQKSRYCKNCKNVI